VVHADAHAEPHLVDRRHPLHAQLDVDGGAPGHVGLRENRHHLVADSLDHAPAVLEREGGKKLHAQIDGGVRRGVTHRFVELRAAAHVGEKHASCRLCGHPHEFTCA